MARALLHDSPIYVFDEATSNVDAESENDIMKAIHSLAGKKTVILISHPVSYTHLDVYKRQPTMMQNSPLST